MENFRVDKTTGKSLISAIKVITKYLYKSFEGLDKSEFSLLKSNIEFLLSQLIKLEDENKN